MPRMKLWDTSSPRSSDIAVLVAAMAPTLHGMVADNIDAPVDPGDSTRSGMLFVDSVANDVINLTWTLPYNRTYRTVATIALTVGRSTVLAWAATAVLTRTDSSVATFSTGRHCFDAVDAAAAVLAQIFDDPWDALTSHLKEETSAADTAEARYNRISRAAMWVANIATISYVIHMVATRGHYVDIDKDIVNMGDVAVFFGIAAAALVVIHWVRRQALDARHASVVAALSKLIPTTRR